MSHVNKRVKHHHEIGLPLLELWKLYTDPAASPMVRNFAIVYVEMAFERAPAKVRSSPCWNLDLLVESGYVC